MGLRGKSSSNHRHFIKSFIFAGLSVICFFFFFPERYSKMFCSCIVSSKLICFFQNWGYTSWNNLPNGSLNIWKIFLITSLCPWTITSLFQDWPILISLTGLLTYLFKLFAQIIHTELFFIFYNFMPAALMRTYSTSWTSSVHH